MAMSVVGAIIFYGNWIISVLGFIYWFYQIIRSLLYYLKNEKTDIFTICVLHLLLFIANILYLFYEVNFIWTPIYFTMLILTDITGVWCFQLIMNNDNGTHHMMDARSSKFINVMIALLISFYIIAFFLPDHYGVRCTDNSPPMGPMLLCVFYGVWTCFTIV